MDGRLKLRSWATAANGLTMLRMLLVVPLLTASGSGQLVAAFALMAAAAATDVADGWIARRTGTATKLGAVLDPAADAILVFALQVQLVATGQWPVHLLAISGVSFVLFAAISALAGRPVGSRSGKYVGAALMAAVMLQFLCRLSGSALWDRMGAVVCPLVAIYVAVSVVENIHVARSALGGAYDKG